MRGDGHTTNWALLPCVERAPNALGTERVAARRRQRNDELVPANGAAYCLAGALGAVARHTSVGVMFTVGGGGPW